MLIDKLNEFCDALDVSAAAGVANAGDVIDLGVAGRDVGNSYRNAVLVITVDVAFASAGAAEVAFEIVSDAVTTPNTSSASKHGRSKSFGMAELVAGAKIAIPLQPGGDIEAYERYLGLQVITSVATTTAGSISAAIVPEGGQWKAYDDAVN